jgi:hypothetical protein
MSRTCGLGPVSADQALTLSQQSGCALYVETSARTCARSAVSAFEVAFLVASGKLGPQNDPSPPPPPSLPHPMSSQLFLPPPPPPVPPKSDKVCPPVPPKPRRAVSQMALNKENFYSPEPATNGENRSNGFSGTKCQDKT